MPKNQSYGETVRNRAGILLKALLDFDCCNLDDVRLERLQAQGMGTEQQDWETQSPKIFFWSTTSLLVELSQLKTEHVREALSVLENFVKCLKRTRKKRQGITRVEGYLILWSTDIELNLKQFRHTWDVERQNRGMPPLEPQNQLPDPPSAYSPRASEKFGEPSNSNSPNQAPQSSPPEPEPEASASDAREPDPPRTETDQTEEGTDLFTQLLDALRENLEHSPAARLAAQYLGAFLGIEPHARIRSEDRQDLLQRVGNMWLRDYRTNALSLPLSDHRLVLLELENTPTALHHNRNMVWENPLQFRQPRLLSPEAQLIDEFNAITPKRRLLILGAPGSGKTIALIELLQPLLEQAKADNNQPIPVLFNLSSYGSPPDGRDFRGWLVTTLERQYSVTKPRARRFIDQQKLLLLLDGLDEVRSQVRNACIRNINEFLLAYSQVECVICSRQIEYEATVEKLQLEAALSLQPLDPDQAISYLAKLPQAPKLQALIQAIQTTPEFQKLAETPLMLNVMAVAYQYLTPADLQRFDSIDDHRRYLFDVFTARLLDRQRTVDGQLSPTPSLGGYSYSRQEVLDWLVWLARHMVDHEQTVFLIEQLQPTWLDSPRQIQDYNRNTSVLIGVVGGITSAGHLGPNANWTLASETLVNFGPILGITVGAGVVICLLFNAFHKSLSKWPSALMAASIYVVLFGLLARNYTNPAEGRSYLSELTPIFIDWAVFVIFLGGLPETISLAPKAQWSWSNALRYSIFSALFSLCVYVPIRWLFFDIHPDVDRIFRELSVSVGVALGIGGLAVGRPPDIETLTQPNQGTWIALKNAVLFLVSLGLGGMVVSSSYSHNLAEYPMHAIAIGMVAALMGGHRSGWVLIQHFSLRLTLWCNRYIPWNYARFLDFSVRRMFLQRAGGGYLFMHRSLMEHLAEKWHC